MSENKSAIRTVLEALISIMTATSIGLNAWMLSKINEHDKVLAAIAARLPDAFPPIRYQDDVARRFDNLDARILALDNKIDQNRELLIAIQAQGRKP